MVVEMEGLLRTPTLYYRRRSYDASASLVSSTAALIAAWALLTIVWLSSAHHSMPTVPAFPMGGGGHGVK